MQLSLLTYSMIFDEAVRLVTPDALCRICTGNGIYSVDIMDLELKL